MLTALVDGTVCYNDNEPSGATSFAPLIVSSTFTQTCQFAGGVNSLYCPELHDSAFPTGTHTLSYNAAPGFVPFIPTTFIIANGVQQATTYVTVVSTSTAPAVAAGTVTVVVPSLTTTSTQNVAVTQTSTVQQTTVITSCYTTPTPQTTTTCSPLLPATTGVSCPGSGGQTYKGFVIECYNDRYNSDLKNSPASSLSDCINQCINTNGCVDVSFVPGSPGVCYMKNNIGAPQTNYGVWAARNWYAISTSSASPSPTALSCPQNNGQLVYQNSGKVFQVECYIDREDNDMTNVSPVTVSNLNQCIAACDGTRGCVDVSLSGVACYLKNGIGAPRNNSVNFGSRLLSYPSNGVQVSDGASASTSASATKIMKRSTTTAVIVTTASPQALVAGGPVIAPAPAFLQSWCTWCSGWAGPDTTYGWLPTTTITTTQSTCVSHHAFPSPCGTNACPGQSLLQLQQPTPKPPPGAPLSNPSTLPAPRLLRQRCSTHRQRVRRRRRSRSRTRIR